MYRFNNLKIRTKIIIGFLLVALIAGAIGAVGIFGIQQIEQLDQELYETMTVPLGELVIIAESFQRIRGYAKDIIMAETEAEINQYEATIDQLWVAFDSNLASYITTLFSEEGLRLCQELQEYRILYGRVLDQVIDLTRAGDTVAAIALMNGEGADLRVEMEADYRRLMEIKVEAAEATADNNSATATATTTTMIIILLGGMVLAVIIGLFIARVISKPIQQLRNASEKLSVGDIEVEIESESKDEIGELMRSFAKMVDNIRHDANIAQNVAAGNLNLNIEIMSDKDVMAISLKNVVDVLNELVDEAGKLTEAAVAGRLETRGDAAKFSGGYQQIVSGVNQTLDAVIEPIQEASAVLTDMSQGNLRRRVEGDYQGDHAEIKLALNSTLDALGAYIEEIASVLTDMANSNFDVSVDADYLGDFAPIKAALIRIIDSFNEMLFEMNSAAEQVSAGSRQVSDGSQALSQGATEQASSIEQLTASINEIADQTKQNALSANEANDLATTARTQAEDGNSRMQQMQQAMEDINTSSNNISKIIKVIDEIAFQTNILALNAAVEAARAGQHGKGFAVVAEEVRNLAARSAQAAKETTEMIEGSISKAQAGTEIADATAAALSRIVTDVAKAADLVSSIANASNEQASAITQVNQGVEQVSQVVQANSATSEESAATSEELSGQAELLQEMIARFQLRSDKSRTSKKAAVSKAKPAAITAGKSKPNISLADGDFGKY